jgi:hypothetical protein
MKRFPLWRTSRWVSRHLALSAGKHAEEAFDVGVGARFLVQTAGLELPNVGHAAIVLRLLDELQLKGNRTIRAVECEVDSKL